MFPRRRDVGNSGAMSGIDVVLPAYDEATMLDGSVRTLRERLAALGQPFTITIVDNASTDGTSELADRLAGEFADVRALHTPVRGKGHAIALGWRACRADVLAFMDVDLASDLSALDALVAPLLVPTDRGDAADVSIGSRYHPGATVMRSRWRRAWSLGYRSLARATLATAVTDPPCGFKAIRRDVARELVPDVVDRRWFFDTELVVLAERRGYRIREIPVDWTDRADTRVSIPAVVGNDVVGLARLARSRPRSGASRGTVTSAR